MVRLRAVARPTIPRTPIPVWIVALVCVGLFARLLLPIGPDVSGSEIEGSFRAVLEAEEAAPPSNEGTGIKSLDCSRKLIVSNSNWTCKLEREIALLPDASGVYGVSVEDDGCWTATADEDKSNAATQLIGIDFDGCTP